MGGQGGVVGVQGGVVVGQGGIVGVQGGSIKLSCPVEGKEMCKQLSSN